MQGGVLFIFVGIMKKLYTIALLLAITLTTHAQLGGTGYYLIHNAEATDHIISLANNKLDYDVVVKTAGGGGTAVAFNTNNAQTYALNCAIKYLQTDIKLTTDDVCIDPSTIIYIKKRNTNSSNYDYDLIGQSTSLLNITTGQASTSPAITFSNVYAEIKSSTVTSGAYTASVELKGTVLGMSKSLGKRYFTDQNGSFGIGESITDINAQWVIEPISSLNVKADVKFGDKYYTTMYVPFAFTLNDNVLKAYAVKSIGTDGSVDIETVAENGGTVPAGTPVLLECSSNIPSECHVTPTGAPRTDNETAYSGTNLLQGAYFCNLDGTQTFDRQAGGTGSFNANNYTAITNPQKFVLGITSDKLGFVKATGTAMPANKAWLEYTGTAELVLPFEEPTKQGDVNRDGKVDVNDLTALVNIVLGKVTPTDNPFNYDFNAAEIDGNNGFTVADVTSLVNLILNN